jgi:hypothetical protein
MKITANTLIPLGSIVFFFAVAMWLGGIQAAAENNKVEIQRVSENQKEISAIIHSIDQRLSRIEGKLGIDSAK